MQIEFLRRKKTNHIFYGKVQRNTEKIDQTMKKKHCHIRLWSVSERFQAFQR